MLTAHNMISGQGRMKILPCLLSPPRGVRCIGQILWVDV